MSLKSRPLAASAVAGVTLAGLAAAVAFTGTAGAGTGAQTAAYAPPPDRTSAEERRRVDSVQLPAFAWSACHEVAECATVKLPLDYDKPDGEQVNVAVARVKAADPAKRLGTLFVNPGGPGGSGVAIATAAPNFLSREVLDRFDVVGFDPRGIDGSGTDPVRCFANAEEQTAARAGMEVPFPIGATEEKAFIDAAKRIGRGCSTTGRKLAGAMSTAEAARDMDVLRRALGDEKLTYLGFSYGTALGQYYANMFPDRVRAVVVDGVINPKSWVGDGRTRETILDDRLRSADGAYRALHEILVRCGKAGAPACPLAAHGDPVRTFDRVAQRLKAKPLVIDVPDGAPFTITYAGFISGVLGSLYGADGWLPIVTEANDIHIAQEGATGGGDPAAARARLADRLRGEGDEPEEPYNNGFEAYSAVTCTDGLHPRRAESWPAKVVESDRRAPYFGRAWAWSTVQCAGNAWTVRDEDAYRGPFDRRTSAPVLVVGNYYDPATNYDDAVSSSRLLKNARLLSSDSWGHTAYGSSACATGAVDAYLVAGTLPAAGTVCVGDVQPFQPQARAVKATGLPPVAPRVPRP